MNEIKLLIEELNQPLQEEELEKIQEEYISYINEYLSKSDHKIFKEIDEKKRIVVIGDLHSDSISLTAIFNKLKLSRDYDYLRNGVFVFLGDYLDRGAYDFQLLRFILKLKSLLRERCLLLKGNHDIFLHNADKGFYTNFSPHNSLDNFKNYLKEEVIFKIKEFYDNLPYFAYTRIRRKRFLFVHGGIPRDSRTNKFDTRILGKKKLPLKENDEISPMLSDLIWNDASESESVPNYDDSFVRQEFCKKQFEKFIKKNDFDCIIRGHDVFREGYKTFYKSRLVSIISTGGEKNEVTGYNEVITPSFIIIKEDAEILIENIYTNKFIIRNKQNKNIKDSKCMLIKDGQTDKSIYLITDADLLSDDNDIITDYEDKKLFKPTDEFAIEIEISGNAKIIINEGFKNFLFNFIK